MKWKILIILAALAGILIVWCAGRAGEENDTAESDILREYALKENEWASAQVLISSVQDSLVQAEKVSETEQTEADEKQEKMIRVLIMDQGYKSYYHEEMQIEFQGKFEGSSGEIYETGETLELTPASGLLAGGNFVLSPLEENARIKISSLSRGQGAPSYRGSLTIYKDENGLRIVNTLPLEEYLWAVVPSEMPASYPEEALKAQAVCARTYACVQMTDSYLESLGAQVDDSVSYQVYQNSGEAEEAIRAVEETSGEVLLNQGALINAYYFSTSCGATGTEEIWWEGNASLTPYLQAKTVNAEGEAVDLSSEEAFEEFLEEEDEGCFDADVSWYRWEAQADLDTLTENVNAALKSRYAANPEAVLTKEGDAFVSREIESVGRIQGLEVLERDAGGAAVRLQIRGSEHTVQVMTEYNVRALLNLQGCTVQRGDGTAVAGSSLLPSACVLITPVFDEDGELAAWHFEGGGYGHGVGLSQNGADCMAEQGMSCEEILQFYYPGAELTALTDL